MELYIGQTIKLPPIANQWETAMRYQNEHGYLTITAINDCNGTCSECINKLTVEFDNVYRGRNNIKHCYITEYATPYGLPAKPKQFKI